MEQDIDQLQIDWCNFWLKGIDNGIAQRQPIQLFLMQENQWLALADFPHDQQLVMYLGEKGTLTKELTLSAELPDTFVYDPRVPTPALLTIFATNRQLPSGGIRSFTRAMG